MSSRSTAISSLCLLFLALVPPGCYPTEEAGEPTPRPRERAIINGQGCPASEMPSAVALLLEAKIVLGAFGQFPIRSTLCTGTLIAPDTVLTAAHCLYPELLMGGFGEIKDEKYLVSFTADLSALASPDPQAMLSGQLPPWPADAIPVKAWARNPGFSPELLKQTTPGLANLHDVALVFLEVPVDGVEVTPAILITKDEVSQLVKDTKVRIAGWGQQTPEPMNPLAPPPKGSVGVKFCAESFINELAPHEMQIGAGPETSRKCHGDSGGPTTMTVQTPFTSKERVIGITSHAYDQTDCAKGGADTRVDAWLDWIEGEMRGACQQQKRSWCAVEGIVPPAFYEPKLPEPAPDLGLDAEPVPDGGEETVEEGSGCGCHLRPTAGLAPLPVGLWLALGLLLAIRRRRPRG